MTEKRNKPISRREALKAIGAVTGVTVLSAARGDWETPLVQVGALPAHAQASGQRLTVFNKADATIWVSRSAAASMKAAPYICEGVEIPVNGQTEFGLAPGSYDITACTADYSIPSKEESEPCFTAMTLPVTIVEGKDETVTFECPPEE